MAISDLVFIDSNGFNYPDYPTILAYIQDAYRTIYGQDVYLEADSQDGQWVAVQALMIYDTIQVAAAVYNSFSPLTAIGDALSRNVKINGISRRVATYSTADLKIIGTNGTQILNGLAEDSAGIKWRLPETVTIPSGGEVTVTATAETIGAITAGAGTITKIVTPTLGWQSVTNLLSATVGVPVESDGELRIRQAQSTMIPSQTVMDGITGAVQSLAGVTRARGYENNTNGTDGNGLPAHNICLVVEGGTTQAIAEAIAAKKPVGVPTYGTTSATTYDTQGVPNIINFYRPTIATISVEVSITAGVGYLASMIDEIKAALVEYVATLKIGDDIYLTKLFVPANLLNQASGQSFDVTQIRIKKNSGSFVTSNIALDFNEVASTAASNITVIVA
jgi:uncharacterized phage protein gp47/JayE